MARLTRRQLNHHIQGRVKILNQLPGRVRLYVPGLTEAWSADAVQRLRLHEGVVLVDANALTQRVLVLFDPHVIDAKQIRAAVEDLQTRVAETSPDSVAPIDA